MKLFNTIILFSFSVLIMALCLVGFSWVLLHDSSYFNFNEYEVIPLVLCSFFYGFLVLFLVRSSTSKRVLRILTGVAFVLVYLFLAFQIAFEVRSVFGATWLSEEVFWELLVYKGKGIHILGLALIVKLLSFRFLNP